MLSRILFNIPESFGSLFVEFLLAALAVFFFATRLTKHADRLERLTPISEVWIGMIFLAFVTSLPEAVNSLGATFIDGAINLGVGNLLGSNMCNVVIIVVLDFMQGPGPILLQVKDSQALVAMAGILIMSLVGASVAFHQFMPQPAMFTWTAPLFSVVILVAFLLLSLFLAKKESRAPSDQKESEPLPDSVTLRKTIGFLAVYALVLVVASIWLLKICDGLARQEFTIGARTMVLGHTVTGASLLAITTSFPELFVSLCALKMGRVNMAVANVLGSNLVNMAIIPLMHLFTRQTGFYADFDPSSLLMLCAAIMMSALFAVGLFMQSKKSFLFLGWEAMCILITYLTAAFLVIKMSV